MLFFERRQLRRLSREASVTISTIKLSNNPTNRCHCEGRSPVAILKLSSVKQVSLRLVMRVVKGRFVVRPEMVSSVQKTVIASSVRSVAIACNVKC